MVLRPYRTSHNGQPSTQYGISIQLRASDAQSLVRNVIAKADEFRMLTGAPMLLEAADELGEVIPETIEAKAMEAEFYPEPTEDAEYDEYPEGEDDSGGDDGRTGQPASRPESESPRRKSEQTEEPAPPADPPALVEAIGKFKLRDKQGKLDWFEELKQDLYDLTGSHERWASIREAHGGNTAQAAAACFREAWLAIANLKGAA
jgi:hypothetical protein